MKKRPFQPSDSKTIKHYFRVQNQLKLIDGVLYRRIFEGVYPPVYSEYTEGS